MVMIVGAAISKQDFSRVRNFIDPLGEGLLLRNLVEVGCVDDTSSLFADCSDQFWMIVTQTRHTNASHSIQITSAIRVPKPNTFTVCKGDW
jgi:hypothetical protein